MRVWWRRGSTGSRNHFPELSAADPRFDAGHALSEQDHADLDQMPERFTRAANRGIKLAGQDEARANEEAGYLDVLSRGIKAFLQRQLSDEEELAVPIILHRRPGG